MYLAICGPRDMGKNTHTTRILRETGVRILVMDRDPSSGFGPDKECCTRQFESLYAEASSDIGCGVPAAILINDVDRVLKNPRQKNGGECGMLDYSALVSKAVGACSPIWARYYGAEPCTRVPVIMTCDSLESLYGPLMMSDIMRILRWVPEMENVR